MPAVIVTGSLNMDFVAQVPRLPAPGETISGSNFVMIPGGKGANQACAAGKLARTSQVKMVGRVGLDPFADHLKASLAAAGVDVSAVLSTRSTSTGVALIWVDPTGQNSIVVVPAANGMLTTADTESVQSSYSGARCALFQLETPLDTVAVAMRIARAAGALTILDPAPAQALPPALLANVDILTPNETEASILLHRPPSRVTAHDAPALAADLRKLGPKAVILKLGDQGAFYSDGATEFFSPSFPVRAVDATAAGDTFNAGLAIALAEDQPVEDALRFANAAAAISVTRLGAQASAPSRDEVERLLNS
jgi:ribokinase